MEPHHDQDEAARSTEILHQSNVFLEQVKTAYQKNPEVYKELFRLLNSYATSRDKAHHHISAHVEVLFRGTATNFPQLHNVLTRTVQMEKYTPYAAALVNSAINRTEKTTVESTAAEDSSEEGIEESAMKTTKSMVKDFAGFIVDVNLFEGFSKRLPANARPVAAGRTMRTVGISRFHKEEGKRYMELVKVYFSDRPDVYEGYDMAIDNFERRRIRANRRLYVKARIMLRDSPQLFEGFRKFMPINGKGELFRTPGGETSMAAL